MRTIRTKVYKFSELSDKAKQRALLDQVIFLIETNSIDEDSVYWGAVEKMEKIQTPWFLGETLFHDYKEYLISDIEANEYEFFEDGDLIPAKYYTKNEPEYINIDTAVRISRES